jgi:hypothetical protein
VDNAGCLQPADGLGNRATSVKFLLRDRDCRYTRAFDAVFAADGIQILTSPRVPRANAICERMIETLRRELLDKILIVNERHLQPILAVYRHHFNTVRPHRTLAELTPVQAETQPLTSDQPHRLSDSPQIDPRRTHQRVPDLRMTQHRQLKPARQTQDSIFESHRLSSPR